MAGCTTKSDATPHQLRQAPRDGEPDTSAFDWPGFLSRAMKRLKDLVLLIERNTDNVVDHADAHDTESRLGHRKSDRPAVLSIFDRVRPEVDQDLRKPRSVSNDLQ